MTTHRAIEFIGGPLDGETRVLQGKASAAEFRVESSRGGRRILYATPAGVVHVYDRDPESENRYTYDLEASTLETLARAAAEKRRLAGRGTAR